jgi:hypothetical protein
MSPTHYDRHGGWNGVTDVVSAMRALDITNITAHQQAYNELGNTIKVTCPRALFLAKLMNE